MWKLLLKGAPWARRFVPGAIKTAKTTRVLTPAEMKAAQSGVQAFTAGAAGTAGKNFIVPLQILRRAYRTQKGMGRPSALKIGGGILGGGLLAGKFAGGEGPSYQMSKEDILRALNMGTPANEVSADYFNELRDMINKRDYLGDYGKTQQAGLDRYLQSISGYSAAQGAALEKAYGDLAEQSRAMGEQAMSESQMAATDIDRLYGAAAADAAQYGAGQGLTTGPSDVSGLTGVSGQMAEMPDVTRTYGQSLADWMGRQGIISRQDLESAGQSYLAQGIGSKAQLEAEAAGLGSRAQYDLANRLAEMEFQAQQQRANELFNLAQLEQQTALESKVNEEQLAREAGLLSLQAPALWEQIKADTGQRNMWRALGVTDAQSLAYALQDNPEYAQLLMGS